jgi:mRNA interferase RelE/StbE
MNVEFLHEFNRDLDKLSDQTVRSSLSRIILDCERASSLKEISDIKKLKGFKNAYRIRIGNYRLGFYFEKGTIEFARLLHRKDIYRSFP